MVLRRWLLTLAVVLGSLPGRAVQPYTPVQGDPMREPWRWRAFADMNGLDAQCVIEGADGTIWFGTADGLSSYDGFEWKRHLASDGGIIAGWVATMGVEPDGTLDAAGWWGISQFRDGRWSRLVPAPGVRFADVRRLAMGRDGSLWAATSWGALRRRGAQWTLHTTEAHASRLRADARYGFLNVVVLPEAILSRPRPSTLPVDRADLFEVTADAAGRIWFGTKGGEILCHTPDEAAAAPRAPGRWVLYHEGDGVPSGRLPSLLSRRDGSVWVANAPGTEAAVFTAGTWRTVPLPEPGIAPDGSRFLETHDDTVWLSARYVLYACRDGEWTTYRKPEIAVPTALNLLLQSRDGALWLVGPNTDIQRVDYGTRRWTTLRDLNFQWESPAGAEWFLHRDGRAVVLEAGKWRSYGVEDGLIDAPVALLGTRDGIVWAAGSDAHVAATARFDGTRWIRETHPRFSWGIDYRAVFESSDRSLWFGAAVDSSGPPQHRDGILQFRNGTWVHHHQPGRSPLDSGNEDPATLLPPSHRPEPIEKFACFGESRDGRIWSGRNVLVAYDGKRWEEIFPSSALHFGVIECMLSTPTGDVWIGTRQYGAWRHDGDQWQQYQGKGNLLANTVLSLAQTSDGSIWAATDRGFSRFDGHTWMNDALTERLTLPYEGGGLKPARSGKLWLNRHTVQWQRRAWTKSSPPPPDAPFWTVCHDFQGPAPRTAIIGPKLVPQLGNLSVLWTAASPWREAADMRIQYSHRLNDEPWSAFTSEGGHAFFALPSGRHRLEVRARDQDFNVDSTPSVLEFVVLPPVWRQPWFIGLMIVLGSLLATQSFRVLLEKRRLQKAHDELEERVLQRTAELEAANRELESFSYSVSHDLRAPLRRIDGFSRAILEDYAAKLGDDGREDLRSIRESAQRMGRLIEAMLSLSRVTRGAIHRTDVDLSAMAREITADLARIDPGRSVTVAVEPGVVAHGDAALLRNVLENLLGNAWKFTSQQADPRIEFGMTQRNGGTACFVRDNGAGFDRDTARKLFAPFQRYHMPDEFPGTGIGLATVQRIIHRHGGAVDAESRRGEGATFYFTVPGLGHR